MPYFQLRITCSPARTADICLRACRALIRQYNLKTYSTGYEKLNKYGEPCDPHIHFNFIGDIDRVNPKRCMSDWLKRHFANLDIELKGNKQWSLQMVEEPKDFVRWFRYPLKEGPVDRMIAWEDSEEIDQIGIENFINLAKAERSDSIHQNILRREKLRNKDQFKQKMYEYIEELRQQNEIATTSCSKKLIWVWIFNYYRKIEKPINFEKVEGYCNLWLSDHDLLRPDDAYDLYHKKS